MERLYAWRTIKSDNIEGVSEDLLHNAFFDEEIILSKHGIRSRVKVTADNSIALLVPQKDEEIARAILAGEIREVIDNPVSTYHVFDDDLSYKNKKLYKNRYAVKTRFMAVRSFTWIGILLVILLLLLRFVKI